LPGADKAAKLNDRQRMRRFGCNGQRSDDLRAPSPLATGRRRCWSPGRWWFAIIIILAAASSGIAAPALTASLDRNTVPLGESVTLNLTFMDVLPTSAPRLPPIPNITVDPNVSQSSQLTIVNGKRSDNLILAYKLIPTAAGDMVIPSFQVPAAGGVLTTQPLILKVLPASANPNAALTNLAFLRLVVPKTEVYLGEPFPVEMHLYWQDAREIRMPQLRAEGFSLGQMPKPTQTRTQLGNGVYNVAVFKLTATAARTGSLTLGPAEEDLTILIPMTNRRSRDPFESFFGGPQYQQRPTTLTSDAVAMRVLPLPTQNVPEGFNGAIGSYQLSVTAGPTNVGVGDPITVRMQISGNGPLDAITLPPQPQWRDFNTYPATAKLETRDELGLSGVKSFEQVIIPQNHEIRELPPVRFSFFNPAAKSYRTLTGPRIPLTVRPSGVAVAPPPSLTNATGAATPAADDILHIKPRLELAGTAAPLLVIQPWFLALQGLPALAWLALLVRRKRNESLANNPRLRRQREVALRIRDGLKELRVHADARESDQFFATLFRLLQEQLGERLDLPASAITEAVIDEKLRVRALPGQTLKALHELFQTSNLARYAPVQSSQELAALIPKLEGALRDLQQLKA
jgi:hypothetical protein